MNSEVCVCCTNILKNINEVTKSHEIFCKSRTTGVESRNPYEIV